MKFLTTILLSVVLTSCVVPNHASDIQEILEISHQPIALPTNCGDGNAKLYDECGDQTEILRKAIEQAKLENKNVLIVYGGEWCIWCHVLDKYFKGQFRTFDYEWRDSNGNMSWWIMNEQITQTEIDDARKLNKLVANSFVIAHIESDSTNGAEAISMTGVDPSNIYYYPYVFILNTQGKYVQELPSTDAIENFEIRQSGGKEFRGYNRAVLIEQLQKLKTLTNK